MQRRHDGGDGGLGSLEATLDRGLVRRDGRTDGFRGALHIRAKRFCGGGHRSADLRLRLRDELVYFVDGVVRDDKALAAHKKSICKIYNKVGAEEALQLGLVERVTEADNLVDEAVAYIEKLATTSAPAAIAATKRLVYGHLGKNYREALEEAEIIQNEFVSRDDAREGAMALIEKRAPKFERLGD